MTRELRQEELWSFIPEVVAHSSQGGLTGAGGSEQNKTCRGLWSPVSLGPPHPPDAPRGFLALVLALRRVLLRLQVAFV